MKNKFYIILTFFLLNTLSLQAEELKISSSEINFNKKLGLFELNKDVVIIDNDNNKIEANEAIYNKKQQTVKTTGFTKIFTNEGYVLEGSDINLIIKKKISSSAPAIITDIDKNVIKLATFDYLSDKKFLDLGGQ